MHILHDRPAPFVEELIRATSTAPTVKMRPAGSRRRFLVGGSWAAGLSDG